MDAAASPARTDGRPTRFVSTTNTRPSRTARTPFHSGLEVITLLPETPARMICGSRLMTSSSDTCGAASDR
jgi:hypothetical protein